MVLDELEWKDEHARLSPAQRDQAVDDLIALVGAVDGILQAQSAADAVYFARIASRQFSDPGARGHRARGARRLSLAVHHHRRAAPALRQVVSQHDDARADAPHPGGAGAYRQREGAMTIPQWTLLGFAAWTLALLMATVGVYRWGNILFAKAAIASFRSDALEGAGWYQRGTRAHANCIENLPVFGVDRLCDIDHRAARPGGRCTLHRHSCARIMQSCVHISHEQTNAFVAVRFSFYSVQLVSFLVLIVMVVIQRGKTLGLTHFGKCDVRPN